MKILRYLLISMLLPVFCFAQEGRTYNSLELALESPATAVALKLNGQAVQGADRIATLKELEVLQLRNCGLEKLPAGIGDLDAVVVVNVVGFLRHGVIQGGAAGGLVSGQASGGQDRRARQGETDRPQPRESG